MAKFTVPKPPKSEYVKPVPPAPARPSLPTQPFDIPSMVVLCGAFGSGKTHIGNMLTPYGYVKMSFVTALRDYIVDMCQSTVLWEEFLATAQVHGIDIPDTVLDVLIELKQWPTATTRSYVYQKPTPPELRYLLQWTGADYLRRTHPQFFPNRLHTTILQTRHRLLVVDDWRFPDEAVLWQRLRVTPYRIRILDPDLVKGDAYDHETEKHIADLDVDAELLNPKSNRITPQTLDFHLLKSVSYCKSQGRDLTTATIRLYRPLLKANQVERLNGGSRRLVR